MSNLKGQKNDMFADIAASGMNLCGKGLIEPMPLQLEAIYLDCDILDIDAVFEVQDKMNTHEALKEELNRQKEKYKPYLAQFAPEANSKRIRKDLKRFEWRIGTAEDERCFQDVLLGKGQWESVEIPHYGEPLGLAVTYYRTEFTVTQKMLGLGNLFICFKGVDYKAQVFVNGSYAGAHEGFFAPFEFDISKYIVSGVNMLVVKVQNDFICGGNSSPDFGNRKIMGDKIYAATGLGYDDAQRGWHHCPPGMGIYQDVYIEARPIVHIDAIFVRPMEDLENAEVWIEINNSGVEATEIQLKLSLYGKNFDAVIFENMSYNPNTHYKVGMGDSLTEANSKKEGLLNASIPMRMHKGRNRIIVPIHIQDSRKWDTYQPWLYQINIELVCDNKVIDAKDQHFGMRFFKMDTEGEIKGGLYLNGEQIRLRGANTMGHEQQCVAKKDFDQLIEDILLAKICHMNFLRLTQRPVQPEVYEFCDRLGLMTQTDLPLFGVLSRSQFCEVIRQSEEMERLVRSHPCNIMISYINEPFPNANNSPQKNLTRPELMSFFEAADLAVRLNNPDRVIKHVDGDYDPPSQMLPDNHCYPCWYNGHGIDIGRLNRGYWLPVKPNWYYGCGEFGSEGLDPVSVMQKYYPKSWLPQNAEAESNWSPNQIIGAQTGNFHYFFYETPDTLEKWVESSHRHQAWATKIMTEAFRRDSLMTTFAIHLFIDAFPSGWMKTIMDVERTPKPAYFAYRDALEPLMVNIRSDRFKYTSREDICMEAWVCNDTSKAREDVHLHLMLEIDGTILAASKIAADIPACSSRFQGFIAFTAPDVKERSILQIKMALMDADKNPLHTTILPVEVFPRTEASKADVAKKVWVGGSNQGVASGLADELGLSRVSLMDKDMDVILLDDYEIYLKDEEVLLNKIKDGVSMIVLELPEGSYNIGSSSIEVKSCGMLPLHFVSRNSNHSLVSGFKADDFRLWFSSEQGMIAPVLESTFMAEDFSAILISGNTDHHGRWGKALAAADKSYGKGRICICQLKLKGRTINPVAKAFAERLIGAY